LKTGHFAFGKIEGQPCKPETRDMSPQTYHHPDPGDFDPTLYSVVPVYGWSWRYGKEIDFGWKLNTEINKDTNKDWEQVKLDPKPIMLGPGWTLEVDKKKSKDVDLIKTIVVNVNDEGITVQSEIGFNNVQKGTTSDGIRVYETVWGEIYATLTLHLKATDSSTAFPDDQETIDFFVRHKMVGACLDEKGQIHSRPTEVNFLDRSIKRYEGPFELSFNQATGKLSSLRDLNTRIIEAMRDTENLLIELQGPGPVENPLHTDFALQCFRESLSEVADGEWLETPIQELSEVPDSQKERLLESGIEIRAQLLEIPLNELRQILRLNDVEARELYLNGWDIPGKARKE
jgi:hypothetical protein